MRDKFAVRYWICLYLPETLLATHKRKTPTRIQHPSFKTLGPITMRLPQACRSLCAMAESSVTKRQKISSYGNCVLQQLPEVSFSAEALNFRQPLVG